MGELQPESSAVQREFLFDLADGDAEFVRELGEAFLEDAEKRVSSVVQALENADIETVAREAHALKGAVGNFDVPAAHEVLRQLEQLGRSGSADGLQACWEIAHAHLKVVIASLEEIVASL